MYPFQDGQPCGGFSAIAVLLLLTLRLFLPFLLLPLPVLLVLLVFLLLAAPGFFFICHFLHLSGWDSATLQAFVLAAAVARSEKPFIAD